MSAKLTPGQLFLARVVPFYVATSASVYSVLRYLQSNRIHGLPSWAISVVSLLARPLFITLQSYYADYREIRRAASNGACVIPTVHEKWPDSITTVKRFMATVKDGYPGELHDEWIRNYGYTFQVLLPLEKRIITFDPYHAKEILATQFDNFEKGPVFREQARSLLGTGVFNSDGDLWKFHRAIIKPFFIRECITDFNIFGEKTDIALKLAKARVAEGYALDIQDLIARFALDASTEFLFGDNVKSLEAGLAYPESSNKPNPATFDNHPSNMFVNAFMKGQNEFALRIRRGNTWPLYDISEDVISAQRHIVDEYIRPVMNRAVQRKKDLGEQFNAKEAENLLDYLVQQTDDTSILIDELVNLLVAGRDTSTSLLAFSVYMMSEYPEVTRKLREEILSTVGATQAPTYDNIREMKYLRAFLNEVLRLYPPLPINARTAKKDTVLHSKTPGVLPYFVPAGANCVFSVFVMHRRKDLWGPDALEFDPERFLDERLTKYLIPNPYIFAPFNAGPRICIGQQFAYNEASYFLVRLLQQFTSFTFAPDAQPADSIPPKSWADSPGRKGMEKIRPVAYINFHIRGGLWVRMKEAS